MRNLKRLVSLLLVLVMSMSLVTPAFAANGIDDPNDGDTGYEGNHRGSITAIARDVLTNSPLADVRFLLEDITAGRYTTYYANATDETGTVTWNNLSAGTYRVSQVGQPETYSPNTEAKIVVLRDDGTASVQTVTFESVRKGRLIICRTDPETGEPLNGGTYRVINSQGQVVWQGSISSGGAVEVPATLPTGNYVIEEVSPPTGYGQTCPAQNVFLTQGNEPTIVTFTGAQYDTITVQLLDSTNFKPIPGATFEIIKAEGSSVICSGKTDSNGLWTSKALDPGTYIVRQSIVVDGYQKILDSTMVTVTNDNEHQNHLVTLYNVPYGSVTVMCFDTTTGDPLPGATVYLYDDNNNLIAQTTSDISGVAFFPNVPDGHYRTVVKAPPGYTMNDASASVDVTGGSDSFVNVTGTELGSIQIHCIDAATGEPIEGATFKVYRMNGEFIGEVTTGANGTAIMTNLKSGTYTIEQVFVPAGYVRVTATQTATVTAGRIADVTFVNRQKPSVTVETVVEGTRQPISGSTVVLVDHTGAEVRRGYTDVNGTVTFEDVEPGTYTAKYAWAPDGYTVVVASQEVIVTTATSGYAVLTADKHSAIIIYKVDSQTQEPLYGATFEVRDQNGRPVAYVTTDKSGVAATDILPPGTYTIREYFAPDHYVPNTEIRTVRVENNDSARETFTNTKKSQITVYAYDSLGNAMENVPYIVYEAKTGQEVAHLLTNNSGFATTEELAPGNYIIVETTIPDNYTLVNPIQSHVVLLAGQASYVRYVHVLKSTIKIQTADSKTGASIGGATYLITCDDSSYTANLTADANGEALTELLPEGIYEIKQITAPEGYILNTTTQTIQVLRDQVNLAKFFNDPMARIIIQSVEAGSNYGLEECSFVVEDKDGKEVFHATTDATGILTTQALNPGVYTVKEIAVKDGYEIVQMSRTVELGTYQSVSVKFEHVAMNSIIVKLTDINDPTKGLAGAHFMVRSMVGDYELEIVTDQSGRAETPVLPAGTYVVHQMTTAEGYMIYTNYQYANVNGNACAMVEFTNRKISGLVIEAMTEDGHEPLAGAEFEIFHENGKLVDHVTTDATGTAVVNDLVSDVYVIKNVAEPKGWTVRQMSQKVTITQGEPSTVRFFYTNKSSLVITLTDELTKEPLANGVFRVSKENGDIVQNDISTDSDGRIVLPTLAAGRYVITQIKAPDGYEIIRTPVTVDVKDNQTAYANITNMPHSGLIIEVLADDNTYLSGAKFEIRDSSNIVVGVYTADESGVIRITDLAAGTYTVKELIVPDGWTARTLTQTAVIVAKGVVDLKFYHSHKSSMIIDLKDATDGTELPGGRFKITDQAGVVLYANETTDESGQIVLPSLDAGVYIVIQIAAPTGYTMSTTSQTVTVKDNETCYVHFVNEKNRGVTIQVCDADGNFLTGARFEVRNSDGKLVGTYTVDANGSVFVDDLPAGIYTINEVQGPDGWTIRTVTQTVKVPTDNNAAVIFYHDHKSTLIVTLKDAKSGEVLAGGTFRVTDEDGKTIADNLTTGADGTFSIPSMNAGRYVIVQVAAPNGYTMAKTTVTVTVEDNQTAYATVLNDKNTGLLVEALDDDGNPLSGASFEVKNSSGVVVATFTTGADGQGYAENLPAGEYTVNETKVPSGWTARTLTQKVTVTVNGDANVKFYHSNKSTLIVTLRDAKTQAPLAGGIFQVANSKGVVLYDNLTTNDAGQFTINSVEAGEYTIIQLQAPEGYTKAMNPTKVAVKDNETATATVLNDKNTGLTVQSLTDDGAALAGAAFEVKNSSGVVVSTFTVDKSGEFYVENLQAGEYTVNETTVPDGWTARTLTQKINVTANGDATLKFYHSQKSTLIVTLRDAKTQEVLAGGTFKVVSEDGKTVYDNQVTGADGQFTIASIQAGRYVITQLSAPEGYTMAKTTTSVEVKDNQTAYATILNDKNTGLTVQVLDDANNRLGGAEFEVKDSSGLTVATFTVDMSGEYYVENLAAGEYTVNELKAPDGWTARTLTQKVTVTTSGDAIAKFYHTHKSTLTIHLKDADDKHALANGEFKITTEDGNVIADSLMTDSAGQIVIDTMEAGRYIIMQVNAPKGYTPDKEPKIVEIKDNQNAEITVLNYKNRGLTIEVLDDDNHHIGGARFELVDADNNIVGTYDIDETGVRYIENLVAGTYTVREIQVPDGWTARTLTQSVEIKNSVDATVKFYHTHKSSLTITLKDGDDKHVLEGGEFQVTKEDGTVILDSAKTDTAGQIVLKSLEAGSYIVKQVNAPEGYTPDKSPKTVVVKDNEEAEITVLNYRNMSLIIEVLDDADNHLAGGRFELVDADGNIVGTYDVDGTGIRRVDNLKAGKYTLREVKTPEGWTARTLTQEIEIKTSVNLTVKFYHTHKSTLEITLKDAVSKNVLQGGVFKLTKANGDVVELTLTTNEGGQIILASLEAGEYILTQTAAPDGYVIKTVTYNVTIKDGQTTYLEVLNYKRTGLTIEVLDSSNNYITVTPNATFEIYDADNTLVGTYNVDNTGILVIADLAPGKYTVKEYKIPEGWTTLTQTQTVEVTSKGDALLRFVHTKHATLTVNLKDANSGAFLEGATYRIYTSTGEVFGEFVTNASGQFIVESISAGEYSVVMTIAPEGYVIDSKPYYVTIKDDKSVVLDLTLKAVPNFRIVNTVKQTGSPIGGNKFRIMTYDGKLIGDFTTDDAGLVNVELAPGTYTVYQTYVIEGVVKNETVWDVVIKAGEDYLLEVKNEIVSRLIVKFVDSVSNAPIYNVKVEIKDSNNNYIGQYTTDNTGALTLTSVLKAGNYKITILSCPDNYIKDTVPKTVEIKTGETTEVVWKLTALQGSITVVTYAGEDNAMMQIAKNNKVAGAVYQITDMTGTVVTTITGDYNGEAHSGPLPIGTYYVQMVAPPTGFQLNNGRATVNVINTSINKRVEVYLKAAYYNMTVKVNGQQSVWAGNLAKYTFTNIENGSSSNMDNFYFRVKIPTDAMRGVSFNTGSFNYNTYYNVEYKTNTNDWRTLASGCSTQSNYSYDISTQGLGLGLGEYVTDIRMVFPSIIKGFKNTTPPSLYCAVLTGLASGYMATVRAEVGGQVAFTQTAGVASGNGASGTPEAGSWCSGAGQYTTYIYAYQNKIPGNLPKTGY